MPIFEYQCAACSHVEELLQKHGAPPPDHCPQCEAEGTMSKKISMTSFQLKGGGWYKDLYASTPKSDGKASSADKASKKSDSASSKSEKSATKASSTKSSAAA